MGITDPDSDNQKVLNYLEQVGLLTVSSLGTRLPVQPSSTWTVVSGRTVKVTGGWNASSHILGQAVESRTWI